MTPEEVDSQLKAISEQESMEEQYHCPECKSKEIERTEDCTGVAFTYVPEIDAEGKTYWDKIDENWHGDCNISYECMECGKTWE